MSVTLADDTLTDCRFASKARRDWGEDAQPYGTRPEELPEFTMQKLNTEAQRMQSFPWKKFLCDLCASVVRNLHDEKKEVNSDTFLGSQTELQGSTPLPRMTHPLDDDGIVATLPPNERTIQQTKSPFEDTDDAITPHDRGTRPGFFFKPFGR